MKLIIEIPESLEQTRSEMDWVYWKSFLQAMTNRYCQGACRYGKPSTRQKYLKRLIMEISTYEGDYNGILEMYQSLKTDSNAGNFEQLLNVAVYCFLESQAPQHPRFHFDNGVESVTRK